MSLRLGIDTGGTFTDAVLLDPEDRVVAAAKALTTRHDLALGIGEAVRRVRTGTASPVGLVCLSTTLATNAIVEGRGGRAGLIMIGLDEAALQRGGLDRALGDSPVGFVAGGHRADGAEQHALDLMGAEALVARLAPDVESFAVCGQFGVRNPAHERAVSDLARAAGRPVTCSHELTAKLDAPRRALTTLLNARLIPEIAALLDAVARLLAAERIEAPVMVVTGDGSLLGSALARLRPVETILSGPAASVVGAAFLAGERDALIADVGGTTTDIAVLREARPRLSARGAVVGGFATMVEAIEVHTAGLGGDSELHVRPGEALALGPRRVVPLSLLASRHPGVLQGLTEQMARPQPREADGRFALRRRAPADPASLGPSARRLWELLEAGPVSLEAIIERHHLGLALDRLLARGLVLGAGFTPSDAAHLTGGQQGWSQEAARLGAMLTARRAGLDEAPEAFARRVLALAGQRTGELLLDAAFASDGETEALEGAAGRMIRTALDGGCERLVQPSFRLTLTVVAVGGPAPLFYPAPVGRLGARLVVPPHHATANAVGAVVGRIERHAHVLVTSAGEQVWRVHKPDGALDLGDLTLALGEAEAAARAAVAAETRAAGAGQMAVTVERREQAFIDPTGERRVLQVEVIATAIARPPLAGGEAGIQ
jgi:N-methylhydantoinase A/oxoprolinase/acetone carboxylase beta subunit